MRNVEKIKALEHELGRYRKKVDDQAKELQAMRAELEEERAGNGEIQAAVDAVLTAVVLHYGEAATDPDAPDKVLGSRLEVPVFSVAEMREKYEIHARRDEKAGVYVLGVAERTKGGEDGGPERD